MQHLTGGTLLARDREFIVLYRGKDFLPLAVSSAIEERRKYGMHVEKMRTESGTLSTAMQELQLETVEHGPEIEYKGINEYKTAIHSEQKNIRPAEASIERTSIKLAMVLVLCFFG